MAPVSRKPSKAAVVETPQKGRSALQFDATAQHKFAAYDKAVSGNPRGVRVVDQNFGSSIAALAGYLGLAATKEFRCLYLDSDPEASDAMKELRAWREAPRFKPWDPKCDEIKLLGSGPFVQLVVQRM